MFGVNGILWGKGVEGVGYLIPGGRLESLSRGGQAVWNGLTDDPEGFLWRRPNQAQGRRSSAGFVKERGHTGLCPKLVLAEVFPAAPSRPLLFETGRFQHPRFFLRLVPVNSAELNSRWNTSF